MTPRCGGPGGSQRGLRPVPGRPVVARGPSPGGDPGGPAKGCGTAPVIVHRKPACLDDLADLVIAAVFGPTLDAAGGWVALTRGIPT